MEIDIVRVEIAKLELKRGDTLLVKFPGGTPMETVRELSRVMKKAMPVGVNGVVFVGEAEISVIREGETQA